jgi:hypothetical protein
MRRRAEIAIGGGDEEPGVLARPIRKQKNIAVIYKSASLHLLRRADGRGRPAPT